MKDIQINPNNEGYSPQSSMYPIGYIEPSQEGYSIYPQLEGRIFKSTFNVSDTLNPYQKDIQSIFNNEGYSNQSPIKKDIQINIQCIPSAYRTLTREGYSNQPPMYWIHSLIWVLL
ncbi:hypothetical protein ACTFIT_005328 [Dictyostelium discoideum]